MSMSLKYEPSSEALDHTAVPGFDELVCFLFSSLYFPSPEFSDTHVYAP